MYLFDWNGLSHASKYHSRHPKSLKIQKIGQINFLTVLYKRTGSIKHCNSLFLQNKHKNGFGYTFSGLSDDSVRKYRLAKTFQNPEFLKMKEFCNSGWILKNHEFQTICNKSLSFSGVIYPIAKVDHVSKQRHPRLYSMQILILPWPLQQNDPLITLHFLKIGKFKYDFLPKRWYITLIFLLIMKVDPQHYQVHLV